MIPFLVIRGGTALAIKVYTNPANSYKYHSLKSNHPQCMKILLIQNLTVELPPYAKNCKICFYEISSLKWDL
jgi:hypothetical protein